MAYNEKSRDRTIEYAKTNYKRVPLDLKLSDYDLLVQSAARVHESVNGFIKQAIFDRINRINSISDSNK